MRETRTWACNGTRLKALLTGTLLLCGCADLALEADRIPTAITLTPNSGLLTAGEPTKLELVGRDQNGEAMTVPSWAPPIWEVSDKSVAEVSPDGTLTGTKGGRVKITARLAKLTADATFRMNPDKILLTAPVIYLNQVAQNRNGSVSLITGRPALLRVFVVADQVNWLESPAVQVTLLQGNDVVFERLLPPETDHIPTRIDESNLIASYDVEVPGSVIQPGVRMVVEVDPEGVVPLAPGSRVRYPAEGSMALDVVEPPVYRIILVPTISRPAPDSSVFDWTDGVNPDSEQMRLSRTILPVGAMEVEVRETYTTSLDLRNFGNWILWRNEVGLLYEDEGKRGYYYGVVSSRLLGVAGIANLAYPVSVGSDVDYVYTHEVGHTMNLYHAPCGGAGGPDPNYPYNNGSIGVWGYDIAGSQLLDPGRYKDVMSYCFDQIWISDYQFDRALTHRLDGDGGINHDAELAASRGLGQGEMLVVWGAVWDGRLMLEPAFVLDAPVLLPEADGPYRVEGLGGGGETMFSLSFTPAPLDHGGNSFVFFVPYEPEWAATLDRMVLTGPEGEYTVTRDGEPAMAVLTDPSTGLIQAIIRDWDGSPIPGEESADVTVTRGIPAGGLR
jgi:hypothetical protein